MGHFVESLEGRRLLSAASVIRPAPKVAPASLIGPIRPRAVASLVPVTPALARYNGKLFQDNNADGIYNTGDTVLGGRLVFNDSNNNGVLDSGEGSGVTHIDFGTYSIADLPVGQPLHLRVSPNDTANFIPTTPVIINGTTTDGTTSNNDFGLFPTVINLPTSVNGASVRLNADGSRFEAYLGGVAGTPAYSIDKTRLTSFTINGRDVNDYFIFDLTNGMAFGINLTFNGGGNSTAAGDQISVFAALGGSTVTLSANAVTAGTGTLSYTNVENFIYEGKGGNDTVNVVGTTFRNFNGRGGNDNINLIGGTFAPPSNLSADGTRVSISANFSGAVNFTSPQTLAALTLNGNSTATTQTSGATLRLGALSINANGGATLDLRSNSLILDYTDTSPYSTIRQYLSYGRSSPTGGIRSSTAAANGRRLGFGEASAALGISGTTTGSFIGQTVDATTFLIRYTFAGDADLDGGVSINDFNRLSTRFGTTGDPMWTDGNFDYDNGISINDFNLLSANFGKVS